MNENLESNSQPGSEAAKPSDDSVLFGQTDEGFFAACGIVNIVPCHEIYTGYSTPEAAERVRDSHIAYQHNASTCHHPGH